LSAQNALRPIDDPEAYAVYASLLPREWLVTTAHAKVLVIQRETTTFPQCMPTGKPLETDWREVVDDFRAKNADVRAIQRGFTLEPPYVVIPAAEIESIFRSPLDWSTFLTRYPDSHGYMQVSAVGFDAPKSRAMIYMAHHCGGLCGGGAHHLMTKLNGQWREARVEGVSNCTWAS
jgi:hypothetical protein